MELLHPLIDMICEYRLTEVDPMLTDYMGVTANDWTVDHSAIQHQFRHAMHNRTNTTKKNRNNTFKHRVYDLAAAALFFFHLVYICDHWIK